MSTFSLVATLLLLVGLEVLLRVTGMVKEEEAPSPLPFQALGLPPVLPGPTGDSSIFMPSDESTGKRRSIVSSKHKKGIRILTFGGSATYGWGYNPLLSFSSWIERGLTRLSPETPVEVINMGVCGWNSSQIKVFLKEALETADPDLVVIYSGNNEFIDLQGLKMAARFYDPRTEYLRRYLGGFYLYRFIRQSITRFSPPAPAAPDGGRPVAPVRDGGRPVAPAPDGGRPTAPGPDGGRPTAPGPDGGRPAAPARDGAVQAGAPPLTIDEGLNVTLSPEDRAVANWIYHRNLSAMVDLARQHGVQILLTTVATNQRDFCSHDCKITDETMLAAVEELEALAKQTLSGQGDKKVLEARIEALDPTLQAEAAQFRLGKLLLSVGSKKQARKHFEQAELLTLSPQRCTVELRNVVRQVAGETGAPFYDTARLVAAESEDGIPGTNEIFDDCHPTAPGHRLLGRFMTEAIVRQKLVPLGGNVNEQLSALEGFFAERSENEGCLVRLDRWAERAMGQEQLPEARGSWCNKTVVGHQAFTAGLPGRALEYYAAALADGAPPGPLHFDRGLAARYNLDIALAREELELAVQALPDDPDVRNLRAVLGP